MSCHAFKCLCAFRIFLWRLRNIFNRRSIIVRRFSRDYVREKLNLRDPRTYVYNKLSAQLILNYILKLFLFPFGLKTRWKM